MPQLVNHSSLLSPIVNLIIILPSPRRLSVMWNLGSISGLCLTTQIITGFILTLHYHSSILETFQEIVKISTEVNYGWALRSLHANGASVFFIVLYLHLARGFYYHRFTLTLVWNLGIVLIILAIASAFLGYVLPWGQISYWGATVITNLVSVVPIIGHTIVECLWGGYSVIGDTLLRFYSLHFILPIVIVAVVLGHLHALHISGSSTSNSINPNYDKVPFHPLFTLKDTLGITLILLLLVGVTLVFPYTLRDPDNFIEANPLITPIHIQPEWYFLFAYAILRCIPNKLGGVLALLMSILLFIVITLLNHNDGYLSLYSKVTFWIFLVTVVLLTWLGQSPVEPPYITLTQSLTLLYTYLIITSSII